MFDSLSRFLSHTSCNSVHALTLVSTYLCCVASQGCRFRRAESKTARRHRPLPDQLQRATAHLPQRTNAVSVTDMQCACFCFCFLGGLVGSSASWMHARLVSVLCVGDAAYAAVVDTARYTVMRWLIRTCRRELGGDLPTSRCTLYASCTVA